MTIKNRVLALLCMALFFFSISCSEHKDSNLEMIELLGSVEKTQFNPENTFSPESRLTYLDSLQKATPSGKLGLADQFLKASALLNLGRENEAITIYENLAQKLNPADTQHVKMVYRDLAISYLRVGERMNCIRHHDGQSCIFPIQGTGIHSDKSGSSKAIEYYIMLLKMDPEDLESRWLLNVAYMTLGEYPKSVPTEYLIKGLGEDSPSNFKPFRDLAMNVGLNFKNMAGGSIIDDFNNDNYLDLVTSSWDLREGMHYVRNNYDGTFIDISDSSGLASITGGLNMMQTDYNNDGFKDIFITRGGWKGAYGNEPNSLLRNNGNGTFSDVTKESGLLSFHPTQTATWNDFNNDGWLDVFIGNESKKDGDGHTCEFYINNKNGTFTNIAAETGTNINSFVKGVTSGDYNNDGWPDIFISTLDSKKFLLRNEGVKDGKIHFKDVTSESGLNACKAKTFPTWFWDYDNDGWLDILICGYDFDKSLAWYAASEALHKLPADGNYKQYLFRNKQDGTFEDVTDKVGLNKTAFAMGSNFGDIDNDGYSDIYLGTGNPLYQSLVPNKMFRNNNGQSFTDVTTATRLGNLQKGHEVSFADWDNDGDEDIYLDMGGVNAGDVYENSFYVNPGQNSNHWISLILEGTKSNRAAVGARIKVTFSENGETRSVYRDLNSGGSFGANPLRQHIGIGSASKIESIEIKWPVSKDVQIFNQLKIDQTLKIKEGNKDFSVINLRKVDYSTISSGLLSCSPPPKK